MYTLALIVTFVFPQIIFIYLGYYGLFGKDIQRAIQIYVQTTFVVIAVGFAVYYFVVLFISLIQAVILTITR